MSWPAHAVLNGHTRQPRSIAHLQEPLSCQSGVRPEAIDVEKLVEQPVLLVGDQAPGLALANEEVPEVLAQRDAGNCVQQKVKRTAVFLRSVTARSECQSNLQVIAGEGK